MTVEKVLNSAADASFRTLYIGNVNNQPMQRTSGGPFYAKPRNENTKWPTEVPRPQIEVTILVPSVFEVFTFSLLHQL